jgi:hypothetical protein
MNYRTVSILTLASFATALSANVLVTETWSDAERLTQDPAANTLAWYSSASGANVTTGIGSMTQATGSSGRHILAYFTAPGAPVTLGVGDMLSPSFTVSFNRGTPLGNGSNNFRVGLYDSSLGARVSADSHGGTSASATFDNYVGYAMMTNIGVDTGNILSIRKRTNLTNGGLIAVAGDYTQLGSSVAPNQMLTPNLDYDGVLSVLRLSADELSISFMLGGQSLAAYTTTITDTAATQFTFDMVAFQQTSNQTDSFSLKMVEIAYTPVPEPGSIALLFGGLCLAGVAIRRRMSR